MITEDRGTDYSNRDDPARVMAKRTGGHVLNIDKLMQQQSRGEPLDVPAPPTAPPPPPAPQPKPKAKPRPEYGCNDY